MPIEWAGDIYCTIIHLCDDLGDLARMRKWTDALARWSGPLSETFMYAAVTRVRPERSGQRSLAASCAFDGPKSRNAGFSPSAD